MNDDGYLDVGRCPGCGRFLEFFEAYGEKYHCHACHRTWEVYQSGASRMWGETHGWIPPTEKEIFQAL